MKIYTDVKKFYNRLNVGVVLLGDHDQIYLERAIQVCEEDEFKGHLEGIKGALSFVKNMEPLYAKNDAEAIFECNERNFVANALRKDPYVKMINKRLGINVNIVEPRFVNDSYYLTIARNASRIKYEQLFHQGNIFE